MATESLHLHHVTSGADVSGVRPVAMAALAGVCGSIVMAGYAMLASATYQHHGFLTRPNHIASVFISPNDLMMSMKAAMAGTTNTFFPGAATLGALIRMTIGAMYGARFGALVAMMRLRGPILVVASVM